VCGAEGPSCAGGLDCSGESCCKSLPVPGGSYNRNADPAYPATVGNFCLDKYEVTVGRFRSFLAAYNAWRGASHPAAGEGTHDNAATGWDTAWTGNLPANALVFTDGAHLTYCVDYTWSDSAGSGTPDPEAYPINCVSWYEAFAFCVWDGGYLPTEAQWEYAAGGGSENRVYPWGNTPNVDPLPANYLNNHNTPFLDVGSEPAGNGRWGQSDLAGGMWEWVFDWDTDYSSVCNDCVNPTPSSNRIARGGSWYQDFGLEAAYRLGGPPAGHYRNLGLRCARTVP
jgi:formylglycine-generating enzyme required for sulfatase activity